MHKEINQNETKHTPIRIKQFKLNAEQLNKADFKKDENYIPFFPVQLLWTFWRMPGALVLPKNFCVNQQHLKKDSLNKIKV